MLMMTNDGCGIADVDVDSERSDGEGLRMGNREQFV